MRITYMAAISLLTSTTTPCGCPVAGLIMPAFHMVGGAGSTSRVMPNMSARRCISNRWYELRPGWKCGGASGKRVILVAGVEDVSLAKENG